MAQTKFVLGLVIIYVVYFVGNIIYDFFLKKEAVGIEGNNSKDVDISSIIEDEFLAITEIVSDEQTSVSDDSKMDEKSKKEKNDDENNNNSREEEIADNDVVFDKDEIANVTFHGGYSVTELKTILSEISEGETNPFVSVTAKMI